jgi:hypothetical protein
MITRVALVLCRLAVKTSQFSLQGMYLYCVSRGIFVFRLPPYRLVRGGMAANLRNPRSFASCLG